MTPLDRRPLRRDARLASGLILFVYVTTHLANHALGSISMATAERGLRVALFVWQSVPGTVLLYGAAATHVVLAFAAVYERRTLRMPPLELLRMVAGFGMPTLLIGHAVATRVASTIYGHSPDYAQVVWTLQHSGRQGLQIALLVPGWLHGCIGLRFAFGKRAWFERLRAVLFGASLLLPVLAVMGFLTMAKEVSVLAADPAWAARTVTAATLREREALEILSGQLLLGYGAAVAVMLVARRVRALVDERRGTLISIAYPDRSVRVPKGWSVLEASRAYGVAHRSACGGQGRCSTCRVRVAAGAMHCPPPRGMERSTLARIGAGPDIRLACQLRPEDDVAVFPLIREHGHGWHGSSHDGLERDVVALRVAVRWGLSFHRLLAHDRLYAIHRFQETVEMAIDRLDIMVVERATDHVTLWTAVEHVGTGGALRSAAALADALDALAAELARTIGCRVDFVIALHRDLAVVGEPDVAGANRTAAVGDAFDAVRIATRPDECQFGDADAATPSALLLVSTALLGAVAPCLPGHAASASQHIELADGRRIQFVCLARRHVPHVIDEEPKGEAIAAIGGAMRG